MKGNKLRIPLLAFLLFSLSTISTALAGDYHQNDSQHVIIYNVTDTSSNHVTGETLRVTLSQPRNNTFFDFSDNTFKAVGSITTLHRTMSENATGGFYYTTISIDSGTTVSADIVCTVSNESATYADNQSEAIYFDRLERVVKIHR